MRPLAHCLILLLAPLAAHASDALTSPGRGGCVYSPAEADRVAPSAAPAARAPAASKPSGAGGAGPSAGGGGDDDVLPRLRAPKWHSFLPGMFR